MTETTITTDEPHVKCGVRDGWDIDVAAVGSIGDGQTRVHVWITPPGGQRIVLRNELIQPSDMVGAVQRGWTLALEQIDWRISQGGA